MVKIESNASVEVSPNPVGNSFLEVYYEVINNLLENSNYRESDFGGSIETILQSYCVLNPLSSFVEEWPTERKPSEEYAKAFFEWILSGREEMDPILKELSPAAAKFDSKREDLVEFELPESFSAFYGPRIKKQIGHVVEELKRNRNTRRAFISVLDGINDNLLLSPIADGTLKNVEYPCTIGFSFNVYKDVNGIDSLSITAFMRSQNMISVWPYDFFVARELLRYVSEQTGIKPGCVFGSIMSAHIYERDINYAEDFVSKYESASK